MIHVYIICIVTPHAAGIDEIIPTPYVGPSTATTAGVHNDT